MSASRPTCLLLDDFPDANEALAAWFELEGWQPLCAESVDEGIRLLIEAKPALVVMEPRLRSGQALSVAQAARRVGGTQIVLIALTAWGREGDHCAYEPTLFDFNLLKPVDTLTLRAIVEHLEHPD